MAGRNRKTTGAKEDPAPEPADDRDGLSAAELARGILAKEIRPRVADIRRLAEAVLVRAKKKGKGGGGKKKKNKLRPDMKGGSDKKVTKLAKIPGQKAKN